MKTLFKRILVGAALSALFLNYNANAQWSLTGNASTSPGTVITPGANFLGTTDAQDFALRTNNIERLRISSAGNISVGSNFVSAPMPVLNVQNKRGTDYYQTGTVATFTQYTSTSTLASPVPQFKVNILDQFPAAGTGFINGSFYTGGVWKTFFSVRSVDGATIIGDHTAITLPSGSLRLAVQGGILTEKVKIALATDATNWSWPDYVFKKDYKLLSLNELESYIKKNKHLPEVPSEIEIKKDGLDVAGMDAALLKKIEELTLYVIELKKEVDLLKAKK